MKKNFLKTFLISLGVLFLPMMADARTENVKNSQEFADAWNDQTVTEIVLKNDVTTKEKLDDRKADIEVSGSKGSDVFGEFYKLSVTGSGTAGYLSMGIPDDGQTKKMHFHDIIMENGGSITGRAAGIISDGSWTPSDKQTTGQYWDLTFGNLIVPKGNTTRLARATRGQTNFYGKVNLSTLGENIYTGGVHFAEGTDYYGEITKENFSAIWFRDSLKPGDAGSGDFIIENNSKVKLRNTGTGVGYPAVFRHWQNMIIGENSEYTATVPGNAVGISGTGKKFIAKKGSKVTLTSLKDNSSISTKTLTPDNYVNDKDRPSQAVDAEFRMEPGSNLYVIGSSRSDGMIDWSLGSNNIFNINSPTQFDIRNNLKGSTYNYRALFLGNSNNQFNLSDTFLDMWKLSDELTTSAIFSYPNIVTANFTSTGRSRVQQVSSTNDTLVSEYNGTNGDVRRMTGLNTAPVIELQRLLTDADKTFNDIGRVRIGIVPDDSGLDEQGNLHFVKLYATKNGANVNLIDLKSENPNISEATVNDGYFSFKNNKYYTSGNALEGTASRSGLLGSKQDFPKVIDITPPEPVKINQVLTNNSKFISGEDAEPNATMYVKINDKLESYTSKVAENGDWKYDFKTKLKAGDKVTVYLEDNAGKAPTSVPDKYDEPQDGSTRREIPLDPPAPITNNSKGNINPDKDLNYRDATFKAAPTVIVESIEPPTPRIDKIARALTKDDKGNQIPQGDGQPITPADWQGKITKVNNTLSYRMGIRIPGTKGEDKQKVLYNAHVTDKIPDHLTFKKEDVKVWKYNKGDARGMPIRYVDNLIGADGKHQHNMGDIDLEASEATLISDPIIEYDETTRELTVGIGDRSKNTGDKYTEYGYEGSNKYGHLLPGENVVIEFPTIVTSDAVKNTIKNIGKITGYSAEEVSADPLKYKEISVTSNEALNPGGEVSGELLLTSAPKDITFETTNLIDYRESVLPVNISNPLVVKDTLKDANWNVKVKLTKEITNEDNNQTLPDSLYVKYDKGKKLLTPLALGEPVVVYKSDLDNAPSNQEEFNISDEWGVLKGTMSPSEKEKEKEKNGLRMQASKIPSKGRYQGDLEWTLENTQ